MTHRIGVIGGDGIGPEVTAEALKAVAATGVAHELTSFDLGWERYERDGAVLPDADLEAIRKVDALLFGAVGAPPGVGGGIVERGSASSSTSTSTCVRSSPRPTPATPTSISR
jgi:3-isopropylmalate dehydrogenase